MASEPKVSEQAGRGTLSPQVADVQLTRSGPNGRPVAELLVADGTPLEGLVLAQKVIFRDLLTKVGLKACEGCRSGLDLIIRQRYDDVTRIDLKGGKVVG